MNRGRLLSVSVLFLALVAMAGTAAGASDQLFVTPSSPSYGSTHEDVNSTNTVPVEIKVSNDLAESKTVKYRVNVSDQSGNFVYAVGPASKTVASGAEFSRAGSLDGSALEVGDEWTLDYHAEDNSTGDVYDHESIYISTVNTSADTTAPTVSNISMVDQKDVDGTVTEGDNVSLSVDISDSSSISEAYLNYDASRFDLSLVSGNTYSVTFQIGSGFLDPNTVTVVDSYGNKQQKDVNFSDYLTYYTPDTTAPTDHNYTVLRDAPTDQSFTYLQNDDSVNVTVDNDTVTLANGSTSGVYVTNEIRSDSFANVTVTVDGTVALDVVDMQAENKTVVKTVNVSGTETVNLSGSNTTGLRFELALDDDENVTGFQVYGELYSGGSGGGTVAPITGGITKAFNGIGNIFGGIGTLLTESVSGGIDQIVGGVADTVLGTLDAVIGVPVAVFDFVTGLIPS